MSEMVINNIRSLETVTTEIRFYKFQTQKAVLEGAIEIGRRLVEAKAMVGHGNWCAYLENEVEFSQSTANNLMRIFEEYGSGQTSVFGNSQSIMKLDYTKALKLLALPSEEREAFAEENDVEHKSVKQIEELIRQRNEAEAREKSAATKLAVAQQTITDQESSIETARKELDRATAEVNEITKKLSEAEISIREKDAQIANLKEHPKVAESTMEQLRKEAEAKAGKEAAEKAEKKFKKQLEQANKDLEAAKNKLEEALKEAEYANKQTKEAEVQAEAAAKQLKLANPEAAVFNELFVQMQKDFQRLIGALCKVRSNDPELADKLRKAVGVVLDQQKKSLEDK